MKAEMNGSKLTLFAPKRIDSSNALQTENEIVHAFDGQNPSAVTIDASEMEYISSAGLRVLLKLKKRCADLCIINVSNEVYDVLDMTGFTEIISVEKAMRELDVSSCEVIAAGAYGTVYRVDAETIVKVYNRYDSIEDIHRERMMARKAFILGVPTAIPYDVVKVGSHYGAVFELLNAKSFAQLIKEGESVEQLAKESTDILKIIHSTSMRDGELPPKKPVADGWARKSAMYLPKEIGDRLIALFDAIPEKSSMIHGDYHVKNLMRQNGESLLIDMDTLSMGHPIYELSAIFSAYEGFSAGGTDSCSRFLGITADQCRRFLDATLRTYFDDRTAEEIEEIRRKAALISYTRIYRWLIERYGLDNKDQQNAIGFCRNYLIDNVPKTENLYY